MTAFLACEIAEIDAVRAAVDQPDFNAWFDQSEVKARFKKACMTDQALRCCYCRKFNASTNNAYWQLEHVLCERHYPQFFVVSGNLALACDRCNGHKGHTDVFLPQPRPEPGLVDLPTASESYSIPHPALDDWDAHMRHVNYQIYTSETPKGIELLTVCKLNKLAVDEGGLNHDRVVAAIRTLFFATVGNPIDTGLTDDDIIERMGRVRDGQDVLLGQASLAKLGTDLADLGRKAAKRKPGAAIAKAREVARKRAAISEAKRVAPKRKITLARGLSSVSVKAPHRKRVIKPILLLGPPEQPEATSPKADPDIDE